MSTSLTDDTVSRRVAIGIAAACALVFGISAARSVLGGDNGEYLVVMHLGGRAHPPGFPLYTLILRATRWLPAATPAHRGALLNVALATATVYVLFSATRAWGARWFAGAMAVVTVAFSGAFWAQATHAEVFMLNALAASTLLWATAPTHTWTGPRRAVILGGLAGVALGGHPTIVLLAPIGLVALLRGANGVGDVAARLGLALAAGAVPLLLYPLMLLGEPPDGAWAWGGTFDLAGLGSHMLREDYGTLSLGLYEERPVTWANVRVLGDSLLTGLLWVGVIPLAIGLAGGSATPASPDSPGPSARPSRVDTLGVLLTWFLCGVVFVAFFNLAPEGVARSVVERFHLLPLVVSTIPLARGADMIAQRVPVSSRQWAAFVVVGFATIRASLSLTDVSEHHRSDIEHYVHNVLASVPEGAVLLGSGDHRLYGFLYVQDVLRERPDVVYVDVRMLLYPWYVERVEAQLGFALEGIDADERVVQWPVVASKIAASGRSLFVTNFFDPEVPAVFPLVPHGVVQRVATPGQPPGSLESVVRVNEQLFSLYEYPEGQPSELSDDPTSWSYLVRADYARSWEALAIALEAAGRNVDAGWARDRAAMFAPRADDP